MSRFLVNFTFLLALLFSTFLLTGTITASANLAGSIEIDLCCDDDHKEQQVPADEGECSDPGCRCPACTFSTLESHPLPAGKSEGSPALRWLLANNSPSDFIRLIDYPPEQV